MVKKQKKTEKKVVEEQPKIEPVKKDSGEYVAIRDISLTIRKGDIVPKMKVYDWLCRGIDIETMVK